MLEAEAADGRSAIAQQRQQLAAKQRELTDEEKKLKDAGEELTRKKAEEEKKLADARKDYDEAVEKADAELADAREKIRDLDSAVWYVQDRSSLSGWQNIRSDADSIESIGTVFPIIFFAVAILISLTTIARMVEEDRGLIGTYKSLGFTEREVRRKYMIYAGLACFLGSLAGTAMAFLALPLSFLRCST